MAITRARRILAVVAGIVAANALLIVGESISMKLFAPPTGFDFNDGAALNRFIAQLPVGAFLLLLATYAVGSFLGGLTATQVANRSTLRPALILGVLLTIAGIVNLVMVPHPLWFVITSTLVYLPCAWLGGRVVFRAATP